MIERLNNKLLLRPEDFSPTAEDFKIIGVFNPGAARFKDEVVLLVRVAEAPTEKRKGHLCSPRSTWRDGGITYEVDCLKLRDGDGEDHRKRLLADGEFRLAFISHMEMVRLSADGYAVNRIERHDDLFGRTPLEEYGVEDPRITEIGDSYYITYVGVSSGMGIATHLMSTRDFESFERHGIIFPCENKDVVLFPEKIGGNYWAFHRPVGHMDISKLAIVSANSPDLLRWGDHRLVLSSSDDPGWYSARIGAGPPPIKTKEGWLTIFHGVRLQFPGDPIGEYTAGAMLTDLEDPGRIIKLSRDPFLKAEADYELAGYVNNLVFPTGIVTDLEDEDTMHVYYGCADSCVAVATFSIREILESLIEWKG